jgi:AcrR family transcriptional regulator
VSRPGLRERKRTETLRRIQEVALRLFADRGYDSTTVEQIASAADVSPATFYRYFATKEDVVVQDEYDPLIVDAFRAQPSDIPPLAAMRAAVADLFAQFTTEDFERVRDRVEMVFEVPALRARQLQQVVATEEIMAQMIGDRAGRRSGDLEVRNLAAALIAAWTTAVTVWVEGHDGDDLASLVDRCLTHLEAGFPLSSKPAG